MDDAEEGVLLIATTMVALVAFALTVLSVMIIYRKRRLQHVEEIKDINEKFSRELLQTQLEVQRETMQHIGREIHDNVGQHLTLAFLYAQQIVSEDDKRKQQINSVATIINESLTDLRTLSRDLTNPAYLENSIDQLIATECLKIKNIGIYEVHFQSHEVQVEMSQAVKSFVIRIIQEFLQNSLKHAECTTIKVELTTTDDGVLIVASDNGKGYAVSEISDQGIGLKNMKKRASIIKSDLHIESVPQQGTNMKLSIPNHQLTSNPWHTLS